MDGRMFDNLVPGLLAIGGIIGVIVAVVAWFAVSFMQNHVSIGVH